MGTDAGPESEHSHHRDHKARSAPHWTPHGSGHRHLGAHLERLSHGVLACAYVISVTYYLQLLSAFVLGRFDVHDLTLQRALTSAILITIALIGFTRGLRGLERVEVYAVSVNLGMIAALLVGLVAYNAEALVAGHFAWPELAPNADRLHAVRALFGLLIMVQGFETSRFLGAEHPPDERIATMRAAQLIASFVYLSFITLVLILFRAGHVEADVTAIVQLVSPVASALPLLIVVAAAASQFSAAVADDAGCAGLAETLFAHRLSGRAGYAVIGVLAVLLTWATDALSIISLASRAFALFYALQCAVAAATAHQQNVPRRRFVMVAGSFLAVTCLLVTALGIPAE